MPLHAKARGWAMSKTSELSNFIDEATHEGRLRVESDLGDGFVRLRVSEAERRQAKQDIRSVEDAAIEMLRNARDAHAHAIFFATTKSGDERRLVMIDDGDGVPGHLTEAIFEPRVTSKLDSMTMDGWGVHGRGMALYSIKENAAEARIAASVVSKGSSFVVVFDTSKLSERRDQSTLPDLVKGDDGEWSIGSGPHNIARTTAEFALAHRQRCTVYFGSPVEIAASLRTFGEAAHAAAFGLSLEEIAPSKRLALVSDAKSFVEVACQLGLEISLRSAHRVLQGEVAPLSPFLETLHRRHASKKNTAHKSVSSPMIGKDHRGLKIAQEDLDDFSDDLVRAWEKLADRYFLEADVKPTFRISRDEVHVVFPVRKQL